MFFLTPTYTCVHAYFMQCTRTHPTLTHSQTHWLVVQKIRTKFASCAALYFCFYFRFCFHSPLAVCCCCACILISDLFCACVSLLLLVRCFVAFFSFILLTHHHYPLYIPHYCPMPIFLSIVCMYVVPSQ